jgi:hypothetical protein
MSTAKKPVVWQTMTKVTGNSQADGGVFLRGLDFSGGVNYHITMSFTPANVKGAPTNSKFMIRCNGEVVYGPYDWSAELRKVSQLASKEYWFTPTTDIMDAVLMVRPYYGGYRITVEYAANVTEIAI